MAVKYVDIREKVGEPKLTEKELAAIAYVEKFIDDFINKNFDNTPLFFDLNVINFQVVVDRGGDVNFKDTRKKLMTKELEKRYKDAGWEIGYSYDEYTNNWILKGK